MEKLLKCQRGVVGLVYCDPPERKEKQKVRSSSEDMLDLIYCLDPVTNLPSGALSQYLSDKTNAQVRDFIERNLMVEHGDSPYSTYPANLREEVLKLDSEFIAKTSRDRFESKDHYEARVQRYFDELEKDKQFQKNLSDVRKRIQKQSS